MSNKDKSKVDSIKDANQPKTLEEALALIAKMQATIDAQKQKENEKHTTSYNAGVKTPAACGGTRLYHLKGCGYYRGL